MNKDREEEIKKVDMILNYAIINELCLAEYLVDEGIRSASGFTVKELSNYRGDIYDEIIVPKTYENKGAFEINSVSCTVSADTTLDEDKDGGSNES